MKKLPFDQIVGLTFDKGFTKASGWQVPAMCDVQVDALQSFRAQPRGSEAV